MTLKPLSFMFKRLGRPLHAVADDRDDFVFQHLARLRHRELVPRDDFFFRTAEVNDCHVVFSFS